MYILFRPGLISKIAYSRYKNFVTNKIRMSKRAYYKNKFEGFKSDIKSSWRCINKLLGRRNIGRSNTIHLQSNGHLLSDQRLVAEALNVHFSSVGRNISQSVRACTTSHLHFMRSNMLNSFMFSVISPSDVEKVIYSLKNKSVNTNCVPNSVMKKIAPIMAPILSVLFNKSVMQGIYLYTKVVRMLM